MKSSYDMLKDIVDRIAATLINFLDTAPHTKSKRVIELEEAGNSDLLLQAIEAERKAKKSGDEVQPITKGQYTIKLKRVGTHS